MNRIIRKIKRLAGTDRQELLSLLNKKLWSIKARAKTNKILKSGKIPAEIDRAEKTVLDKPANFDYYLKAYNTFLESISSGSFFISKTDFFLIDNIQNQIDQENIEALLTEAEEASKNRFNIFELQGYQYDAHINWHLNPQTGKEWPLIFYEDIDFKGPTGFGDIKYSWEPARFQYLINLGQAYWLAGDEKYALVFKDHVETFIDQNPPYQGIHWASGLELGIRVISWIWAMAFFSGSKSIPEIFFLKMICSIEQQAEYLDANLSIGRYANNHLIGEAAALAMTGLMFPALSDAGKWLKKGMSILEDELFKQTYPDGFGVEQAYSYLRFILDFYLQVYLLLKKNNISFNDEIWNRIEKMFEFTMYTMTPAGGGPNTGDSDNARGVVLSNREYNDYRGIMAIGAAHFKRADFKYASRDAKDELIWLLGPAGVEEYQSLESSPPEYTSISFPDAGYSVLRDHWGQDSDYTLIDHGPLGFGSCAHGHADALSFVLCMDGNPVFIDPGTHNYNTSMDYRKYFRGTSAHNTLYVNNEDQATNTGRMSWANPYESKINHSEFTLKFDFIEGSHDGYSRLSDPVNHRRRIFYAKKNYWIIEDIIDGKEKHEVWDNCHLHPDVSPEVQEDGTVLLKNDYRKLMFLQTFPSAYLLPKIYRASIDPVLGHYSSGYGEIVQSATVSFQGKIKTPFNFIKVFSPVSDGVDKVRVRRISESGAYIINHRNGMDIISIGDQDSDGNDFKFNGNLLFISCDKTCNPLYMFVDGIKLSIYSNAIFEHENTIQFEMMEDKIKQGNDSVNLPVLNVPELKKTINQYLTSLERGMDHA